MKPAGDKGRIKSGSGLGGKHCWGKGKNESGLGIETSELSG